LNKLIVKREQVKNLLSIMIFSLLFFSCKTTKQGTNESIRNAIVGQNEAVVRARLGEPTRTIPASNGGKIMVYDFYSKGMYLTPYKSKVSYQHGIILSGDKYKITNSPEYTIYQMNVSHLKVYLDKHGKCLRFDHTLPQEQLDVYHERFKYLPSNELQTKKVGR